MVAYRQFGNHPGVNRASNANVRWPTIKPSMPIVPHDACIEPAPGTSICRFVDLRKFRDLFANEELYFRRTDLFKESDPRRSDLMNLLTPTLEQFRKIYPD